MDVTIEKDWVLWKWWFVMYSKKERRRIEKHAIKRENITTQAQFDKKKNKKNKWVLSFIIWMYRKRKGMKNNQQKKESVDEEDVSLLS